MSQVNMNCPARTAGTSHLVSIVMPARNAGKTIAEALRSILDQPRAGEVIVVNDGSTDDTAAMAIGLNDPRIRILNGPKRGIAAALNMAIEAATLPYVARCDSDDVFAPGRLERQVDWLERHADYIAISGGFFTLDWKGMHLADLAAAEPAQDVTDRLRNGEAVTHFCTWLIRRDALLASGGARPWFETAEDIDMQFRLACQGKVWHDPRMTYGYRLHEGSAVHTRSSARLAFFDRAAAEFLADRLSTGSDAVERGNPPPVPDFDASSAPNSVEVQIRGHLTAQAWQAFESGKNRDAINRMFEAAKRQPLSVEAWRGLGVLLAKIALKMKKR